MTKQEADFIGSMNMCDEISNEAYKKIMCNCEVEGEECEDCISREDLIGTMHVIMDDAIIGNEDENYECLDDIKQQYIEIAKGMKSVQPKPIFYPPCEDCNTKMDKIRRAYDKCRWIPVSERLPEDYGEYICTMSDGNVQECGFVPSDVLVLIPGWSTCEADGFKQLDYRDIKAWMPLPHPYKESEE